MALRETVWLATLAAVLVLAPSTTVPITASKKVVGCYYGSWAGYRHGDGTFEPEHIDPTLCTHFFYAFVGVTAAGGIRILDEWNDLPSGKDFMGRFNAVKTSNPSAKTLVAVGGWNEGSATFTLVANNPSLRAAFARNAADFTEQYGFDGFDVDWEYPADRGGSPSDYEGFVLLLRDLHAVFQQRGLLLTAAVGVSVERVHISYNIAEMARYLDYINLMAYDFHGSWDATAGHHSPLYASAVDTDLTLNVNYTVHHWINSGAPARKLVLGMGTYGRSFALGSTADTSIGAAITGPGNPGLYTQESGSLGYNEICVNPAWNIVWDSNIQAPYAHTGNQWVGFDNAESVRIKAQYATDLGLAGAFIWSLETDDFRGKCGGGKFPILSSIYNTLNGSPGTPAPSSSSTSTDTTSSVSSSSTSTTTDSSSLETTSTDLSSTSTASPDGICSSEGYVRNPLNCQIFYYCQSNGQGEYYIYEFLCPGDLAYDPNLYQCNYTDQVDGC